MMICTVAATTAALAATIDEEESYCSNNSSNENEAEKLLYLEGGTETMKLAEHETVVIARVVLQDEEGYVGRVYKKNLWVADNIPGKVEIKAETLTTCLRELMTTLHAKEFQLSPYWVAHTRVVGYRVILKVSEE